MQSMGLLRLAWHGLGAGTAFVRLEVLCFSSRRREARLSSEQSGHVSLNQISKLDTPLFT